MCVRMSTVGGTGFGGEPVTWISNCFMRTHRYIHIYVRNFEILVIKVIDYNMTVEQL